MSLICDASGEDWGEEEDRKVGFPSTLSPISRFEYSLFLHAFLCSFSRWRPNVEYSMKQNSSHERKSLTTYLMYLS